MRDQTLPDALSRPLSPCDRSIGPCWTWKKPHLGGDKRLAVPGLSRGGRRGHIRRTADAVPVGPVGGVFAPTTTLVDLQELQDLAHYAYFVVAEFVGDDGLRRSRRS